MARPAWLRTGPSVPSAAQSVQREFVKRVPGRVSDTQPQRVWLRDRKSRLGDDSKAQSARGSVVIRLVPVGGGGFDRDRCAPEYSQRVLKIRRGTQEKPSQGQSRKFTHTERDGERERESAGSRPGGQRAWRG